MTPRKRNTLENQQRWLQAYADCGVQNEACRLTGVSFSAQKRWRVEDPEFLAKFKEAEEMAADALETEARRRGLTISDSMLMFLLKGARPEKYRETRHIVNMAVTADANLRLGDVKQLTTSQLEEIVLRETSGRK